MTEKEARIFIAELFHVVNTASILIVDSRGVIHRLNCPFPVLAIMDVPPEIINGMRYRVDAVYMSLDLVIISGASLSYCNKGNRRFYYHNGSSRRR